MMMAILMTIVALAVVLYAAAMVFKRRYKMRAEEVRNQVESIEKASLDADFAKLSRMTLSGDSLTEVENMDKSYHYLMNRRLPEIIEELDEIDEQIEGYHVFLSKTGLETIRKKTMDAISQYRELAAKVSRIKKQAESHQEAVKELKDKYQRIRKILLTKNFSYGQSIDALESSMQNLENLFEDYMKVLEKGDLKKTDEILSELRQKTRVLETALDKIPPIYKNYKNVYPEQMTEIKEAIRKMKEERYEFEFDSEKVISETDDQIKLLDEGLAKIEVENCELLDNKIYENIEKLYDAIEKEYNAKLRFDKRLSYFKDFMEHARKQERELLIELDRLSMNYVFNHNEPENAHSLDDTLKRIEKWYRGYENRDEEMSICYSEYYSRMLENLQNLANIEKRQKEIFDSVASFFKDEQDAKRAIQNFDAEMHRLKRSIDNLNLPGLSNEYQQYFLKVSTEVVDLANDLGKIQVDMDQIEHDLINTQSDLDVLEKKTQEIIDASTLAQECIQYANRYRGESEEVANAQKEAIRLFEKCDYIKSLDTIAHILEKVDENSYRRIEASYKKKSKYQS